LSFFYVPRFEEIGDRLTLIDFLYKVEHFLGLMVESGRDSRDESIFVPGLVDSMRKAWVGDVAGTSASERFDAARTAVAETPEKTLVAYGLTGTALHFKMSVLLHWAEIYNAEGGRKFLGKLIELIDVVLKSLFKAAGVDDALEELKDFIWGSVKDD
jgi:hypothetical protein